MPSLYHIDKQHHLLILEYSGEFVLDDLLELRKQVQLDPDFDPGMLCIDDVSRVTGTNITSEQLSELAEKSVMQPGIKRALVVNSSLQHGLARMYIAYAEYVGHRMKLFKNINDARDWLLLSQDFSVPAGKK